eukprot:15407206-Alexandrium_andersonii.AAC.1
MLALSPLATILHLTGSDMQVRRMGPFLQHGDPCVWGQDVESDAWPQQSRVGPGITRFAPARNNPGMA